MEKKQLLFIEPETLSSEDKQKLEAHGFLVIEHPKPDSLKFITSQIPEAVFPAGDTVLSLLKALVDSNDFRGHAAFIKELYVRLKTNEEAEKRSAVKASVARDDDQGTKS